MSRTVELVYDRRLYDPQAIQKAAYVGLSAFTLDLQIEGEQLRCTLLCNLTTSAEAFKLAVEEFRKDVLVDRSVNMLTNHASSRSNFFQRKTTGAAFISSMPFKMRALSSGIEATRIWRRKVRAIFEKAHSIRLSQEPCLGV